VSETTDQQKNPTEGFNEETMGVILEVFKSEYDAMQASTSTFENRTGVLLTLAGAVLAFEGSNFVIPHNNAQISGLIVAIELLSLLAVTLSILSLVLVITLRKFSRIKHQPLNTPSAFKSKKAHVTGLLIATYWEATAKTRAVIDKRAFWYHVGVWLLFASLVLVTIGKISALYVGG
jgi:hypothetical protein